MEKIFCEEPIKPELSDDTLAHYGVKGMRWRHRKAKKVNSGKRKVSSRTSTDYAIDQLKNARTDEERRALLTVLANAYARKQGNDPISISDVNKLPSRDIDRFSKAASELATAMGVYRNKRRRQSSK